MTTLPRLLVLTDRRLCEGAGRSLEDTAIAAVAGGARTFVLREKDLPPTDRITIGLRLAAVLAPVGGSLIVSSDPVVAGAVGSAWLHLAAADSPLATVPMWSRSCHRPADVQRAAAEGAAAVTISPVFLTASKPGYGPDLGPDGVQAAVDAAAGRLAVYALGGISPARVEPCVAAGARGVAVLGAVMAAADPQAATSALVAALAAAVAQAQPPMVRP